MGTEINHMVKRTVVSTKAVEQGKYFPLSVLDHCMENKNIKVVYYYQTSQERVVGEITKNLRETLSEMLTYFPIVTGRLIRNERGYWKIKCNDAGVRMVEAIAKGSVEGWLTNLDSKNELKLVYCDDMIQKSYYWSTFSVQVTEFEEGGLAIGLSCTHLLADLTSATNFMKAWTDISLIGKMIDPPMFHPLPYITLGNKKSNHQQCMELINHYKSLIEKPVPIKKDIYTTVSLCFSDQMVQACISMAQNTYLSSSIVTPFEALAGLFWVSLSKIKGLRNGLVDMSICVDVRKVLGLDHGFFGSCMMYNKVHAEGIVGENNISEAAKAIGDAVAKVDNEGIMDLIEWFENNDIKFSALMNGYDVICASLEGVNPYLAEFQEGFKPIHVSHYIEPVLGEGQVLILPAPSGEGPLSRVVMVTLGEEEAIKLCEDNLISQFSPTILMKY
ncbi:hypothetical protein TanjilG_08844 [Lupinus angustifolius]|uniref:Protein ECERIFERUM 26-like n=1 Tax=Lupinus angustifolius TaxID=3871 RepID=A0A1J7HXF1_LUPAN|nr:PREDICTED: protein ECERIFERUM 1 [Lupinus angustifolius]OIW17566.1 hypothetical protein TanjilG_08844 [Lupinus angustifolius]